MTRISYWVSDAVTLIGTVLLMVMMLNVVADIFLRYAFNTPIPGTIVYVANYYMVGLAFLGLAVTERHGGHIAVDVLTELMPKRVARACYFLALVLAVVVVVALVYSSGLLAMDRMRAGASTRQGIEVIVTWPSYFVIPLGAAAMLIVVIARFSELISAPVQPETDAPHAEGAHRE